MRYSHGSKKHSVHFPPHTHTHASHQFNDENLPNHNHSSSFHSLPSVMSNSSLSSVRSHHSNYSNHSSSIASPPYIAAAHRNCNPNQLKKNQSLSSLQHKYKGSFVSTSTFSAPISPNSNSSESHNKLDKLPPIHIKQLRQRHSHSNHCNNNSNNIFEDTILINSHPNKLNKHFLNHSNHYNKNKSKQSKHKKKLKRIQSSPALHLDLSTLSIDENSNKLHTHHKCIHKTKLLLNYKIPKSAHSKFRNLALNAEGIKSNILLQFDLAPKNIDSRSSYEITESGAFAQNGFVVSDHGLVIENGKEQKYTVQSTDFVEMSILGRGSSSVVYKTWDLKHKRFVALKCISVFEQDKRKQIMNELALLTNNECTSIVDFHGSYFYSGQIIFCLEYFDIGSLQDLIEINGAIPLNIVSYVLKSVLTAVDYLHNLKNIIYRDIKPSNILIHSNGSVKLSDFGIYHRCKANESHTITEMIGTTIYKCPQRLSGKPYSYLSDIWSIGLCVAQALYPQFPLFNNYDESIMLIEKYILSANQPIHRQFFPKHIFTDNQQKNSDLVIDFMDKCLLKQECQRLSAKQLLQHLFIVTYDKTTNVQHFKSYLCNSNINAVKKEKYGIELASLKQSLYELFTKGKIQKNEMKIPIQQIRKIID